jgi:hypothetical protein
MLNLFTTLAVCNEVMNYLSSLDGKYSYLEVSHKVHKAARILGLSRATATRTNRRIVLPFISVMSHIEMYKKEAREFISNAQFSPVKDALILTYGSAIGDMKLQLANRVESAASLLIESQSETLKDMDSYLPLTLITE